jgi:predicted O-methyltransferase YrrM
MALTFRQRVTASPVAALAVLPHRVAEVGRHNLAMVRTSGRWLLHSREFTNFTYELTELNREHLAWFVGHVAGITVEQARAYIRELDEDQDLRAHVDAVVRADPRHRRLADRTVHWAKRLGWYALARALEPDHIVETGSDKGLGTLAFAAAVLRNGHGRVSAIDTHPAAGYLATGRYGEVVTRYVASSIDVLDQLGPVDLFLHDSLRSREYETAEIDLIAPRLTERAIVLSNTGDVSAGLPTWAERTGRTFTYFQERPAGHWYPGGGIAVAFPGRHGGQSSDP